MPSDRRRRSRSRERDRGRYYDDRRDRDRDKGRKRKGDLDLDEIVRDKVGFKMNHDFFKKTFWDGCDCYGKLLVP